MTVGVRLKVLEAFQEEAYKGVVRIDSETMHKIKVRPGDAIEIEDGRKTVGIVDRAYPSDVGQAIIRMDGIIRRNAKTGIGSYVEVKKSDIKEAISIKIAPGQEGVIVEASPEIFKRGLMGRALIKGDIISLGGTKRRRMTMRDNPAENILDIFGNLGGDLMMGGFGFRGLKFVVVETNPKQAVMVTGHTNIVVNPKAMKVSEEKVPEVTYEDVGGLNEELKKIREMIELPLKHPEIFERLGIESPKGILLHGPPGCGKTLLAKAVANESEANFVSINGPEIMSKFIGEAEKRIRDIFEDAEKNAPSIVFIDEIDAIAPKREESYGEVERRVVAQFLGSMDGMKSRGKVIVIAATNRPNALEPALRRPGRFDREIEIGVPSQEARLEILKIHTRNMPIKKGVSLDTIAERTYGFVGADISALCKEAAMIVLRKLVPNMELDDKELSKGLLDKLIIGQKDFSDALKIVRPSAMREVLVEIPRVKWGDIGGLEMTKQELKEAVEWPLKFPDMFKRMGIRAPKGIFLHGPPGCGKTLLAKAIANESEANFISIKGPELISKWVGESEKGIRKIFEKARQVSPVIIFFDEVDAIAPRRGRDISTNVTDRVINQLLTEIDGVEELNGVVVIGATNRPDIIDPAILRAGRFDRLLLVPVPDKSSRKEILKIHTSGMPIAKDVDIKKLAEQTQNFVGSDIENLCREAAILALRKDKNAKEVTMEHFKKALKKVGASISEEDLTLYKKMEKEFLKKAEPVKEVAPSYLG